MMLSYFRSEVDRISLVSAPAVFCAIFAVVVSIGALKIAQGVEGRAILKGSVHYSWYVMAVEQIPAVVLSGGVLLSILMMVVAVCARWLPWRYVMLVVGYGVLWIVAVVWMGVASLDAL